MISRRHRRSGTEAAAGAARAAHAAAARDGRNRESARGNRPRAAAVARLAARRGRWRRCRACMSFAIGVGRLWPSAESADRTVGSRRADRQRHRCRRRPDRAAHVRRRDAGARRLARGRAAARLDTCSLLVLVMCAACAAFGAALGRVVLGGVPRHEIDLRHGHALLPCLRAPDRARAGAEPARAQGARNRGLTRKRRPATSWAGSRQDPLIAIEQPEEIYDGWGRNVLRIGQDYELKQGETVHDVVVGVQPGDDRGLRARRRRPSSLARVSIGLRTRSSMDRSIVIGGNVTVQPGAAVHRDSSSSAAGSTRRRTSCPGGQHVAIGATAIADRLRDAGSVDHRRPAARPADRPRLSWVWMIVFFVFLVSLLLDAVLSRHRADVRRRDCRRPFTTFLIGPARAPAHRSGRGRSWPRRSSASWSCRSSCARIVVAWIIGKIGVPVRLGDSMIGQTSPASRLQSLRSLRARLRGHLPDLHGPGAGASSPGRSSA